MDWNWRRAGLPPHCSCAVLIFAVLLSWSSLLDLRCEAEQKLAEDEVKALKIIGSKLRNKWDFSVDPCSGSNGWIVPSSTNSIANNVTCVCNMTTNICHVTSILLKSQNLTGELPEEFADLPFLTDIDLTYNYLNGTIPPAWAKLPLIHLSILGNRVTGTIPKELGDMITLEDLVLEDNQLHGSIPASFGKLSNLQRILVTGNYLSGDLPETLGNLKNLTFLLLNGNPISGQIPSFIGNWTKLQRLYLEGTAMEGPFPDSFSKLENITHLMVSNLKGGLGAFPPLQNLKKLQRLTLRNLSIPGQLPDYIGQIGSLKGLDLSFNKLTGPIPLSYEALKQSLNFMYLTSNMLNGTIPDWISTSTQSFDVSYNSFTGLPVQHTCKLDTVNLVSSYASTQSNMSMKSCIRRNLPCDGKATNYKLFINCGGNKVTIDDDEYEDDSETRGASVYSASVTGNWAYSSTGDFVDSNHPYIATTSKSLNITNSELYMNARLTPISLKYYGLCMMEGSYNVKLHFAEIMFTDDQTYTSNGRRLFDVSIQGQNVLHDFDIAQEANGTGKAVVKEFKAWVDGNGTLEIHFYWAGKGTVSIPVRGGYGPLVSAISVNPNFKVDMGDKNLSVGAIVGIVAAGCTMVLLIMALVFLFYRKKRSDNELDGIELQAGQFTLKQIRAATRNFDNINKIGEGGFGPVFKGTLPDGSEIAVKQLSSKSKQGNREFLNEIGVISAVQHPNLVKLFGCCIEGDQLLLVYEYMENNSLARALFGPERYRLHLDWEKRRAIALGIARGLAYLHEESRLKIVHRDIKATNILLDKSCRAKISDFGLAKLDEEENTHISTRIAGTIGYMAPEYAMRGYLTEKADVYSFGIVVLEVVSGMSNTNFRPKEEFVYLLDWACVLHDKGNLLELVDPKLGSNYSKEEALLMLKLALSCTNISPTLRPSMTTVVSMLEGKTTLDELPARRAATVPGHVHEVDALRFKAFENLSHDSQTDSSITDGPWASSSVSGQTTKEDSILL